MRFCTIAVVLLSLFSLSCTSHYRDNVQITSLTDATHEYNRVLAKTLRDFETQQTEDQKRKFTTKVQPELSAAVKRWQASYAAEERSGKLSTTIKSKEYAEEYARMNLLARALVKSLKPYEIK